MRKEVEVLLESSRPAGSVLTARGVSANYLKVIVEDVPAESGVRGRVARARLEESGDVCRAAFLSFV
jgi:hypothetical protein